MRSTEEYLRRTLAPYREAVGLDSASHEIPSSTKLGHAVLIVSPHPDDECINGALALRLKQEADCQVYNFPFSFGSNQARIEARKKELLAATQELGFINRFDEDLQTCVKQLTPKLVICPHENDKHPTHIKAAVATLAALKSTRYSGLLARCEFWHPSEKPNLLLEVSIEDCAKLMNALRLHRGEVERNPYHLRLPFWMMDNSRRGGELILGTTAPTDKLLLSTLYEVSEFHEGTEQPPSKAKCIRTKDSVSSLFGK